MLSARGPPTRVPGAGASRQPRNHDPLALDVAGEVPVVDRRHHDEGHLGDTHLSEATLKVDVRTGLGAATHGAEVDLEFNVAPDRP